MERALSSEGVETGSGGVEGSTGVEEKNGSTLDEQSAYPR